MRDKHVAKRKIDAIPCVEQSRCVSWTVFLFPERTRVNKEGICSHKERPDAGFGLEKVVKAAERQDSTCLVFEYGRRQSVEERPWSFQIDAKYLPRSCRF